MKKHPMLRFGLPVLPTLAVAAAGYLITPPGLPTALAEARGPSFPDLDQLIDYTTVERGVTKEHMLTNPSALEAIHAGKPVPKGTHLVLVDYQSGVLTRYLISEKIGDADDAWVFQAFHADRSDKPDEAPARCYSCHQTRQAMNFMFTFDDAQRFKP